jgi:hypothetical protein
MPTMIPMITTTTRISIKVKPVRSGTQGGSCHGCLWFASTAMDIAKCHSEQQCLFQLAGNTQAINWHDVMSATGAIGAPRYAYP